MSKIVYFLVIVALSAVAHAMPADEAAGAATPAAVPQAAAAAVQNAGPTASSQAQPTSQAGPLGPLATMFQNGEKVVSEMLTIPTRLLQPTPTGK